MRLKNSVMAAHRLIPSPSWSFSVSTTSSWVCSSPFSFSSSRSVLWESVSFALLRGRCRCRSKRGATFGAGREQAEKKNKRKVHRTSQRPSRSGHPFVVATDQKTKKNVRKPRYNAACSGRPQGAWSVPAGAHDSTRM